MGKPRIVALEGDLLGKVFNLAEGVQTPGEHAILAQMGCAHIQGFLIARPMPARDFPEWHDRYLRARSASDAQTPSKALDDLLKPPGAAGKTA